jgi:hypothetical protein
MSLAYTDSKAQQTQIARYVLVFLPIIGRTGANFLCIYRSGGNRFTV